MKFDYPWCNHFLYTWYYSFCCVFFFSLFFYRYLRAVKRAIVLYSIVVFFNSFFPSSYYVKWIDTHSTALFVCVCDNDIWRWEYKKKRSLCTIYSCLACMQSAISSQQHRGRCLKGWQVVLGTTKTHNSFPSAAAQDGEGKRYHWCRRSHLSTIFFFFFCIIKNEEEKKLKNIQLCQDWPRKRLRRGTTSFYFLFRFCHRLCIDDSAFLFFFHKGRNKKT